MFVDDRNQMTTSMWHSSILPVKVNVVYAERNRAIGLKGWNSHKSPLHHYAEKKTTKAMNFENFKFEIPSRTKSTFITAFSPDNSLIGKFDSIYFQSTVVPSTSYLIRSRRMFELWIIQGQNRSSPLEIMQRELIRYTTNRSCCLSQTSSTQRA